LGNGLHFRSFEERDIIGRGQKPFCNRINIPTFLLTSKVVLDLGLCSKLFGLESFGGLWVLVFIFGPGKWY
jgi:hypothetical protein